MADVEKMLGEYGKKFGAHTTRLANEVAPVNRLPTGIFELDYALGGGLPRARFIEIYGVESSCKTNLVMSSIAQNQRINPGQRNVFVDLENSFSPEWAAQWGVDVERLIILQPDYAEQAVDMIEGLLYAEDLGVLAVDSLAGMITTQELSSSADKAIVGGAALAVGKMVRKAILAIQRAQQEGRDPVFLCVNQIRHKIGVMFGDPEDTPGGRAPKFAASLRLRLYGKPIMDPKVSDAVPVAKKVTAVVKKHKFGIVSTKSEFTLPMMPYKGLEVGQSDSWNLVEKMLKERGDLAKAEKGQGYVMFGESYKRLVDCRDKFYNEPDFQDFVLKALMAEAAQGLLPESDDTKEEGGVNINV